MNCRTFRKYAGAFADGELDVQQNLEALEHLNMCPDCARRVDEVGVLKSALRRWWSGHRAPLSLRERVAAALRRAATWNAAAPALALVEDDEEVRCVSARRRSRLLVPMAAAAALLFYLAVFRFFPGAPMPQGTMTVVSARVVEDVRKQHRYCMEHLSDHVLDPTEGNNLADLSRRLSRDLKLRVLSPDLRASGFEFVGYGSCGVQGRPGAHVLYHRSDSGSLLSLYTISRVPELQANTVTGPSGRRFFLSEDEQALTVLAWHDEGETYAACVALPRRPLLEVFDQVRLTETPTHGRAYAGLALASPGMIARLGDGDFCPPGWGFDKFSSR